MQRTTGWESYAADPERFLNQVMKAQLGPRAKSKIWDLSVYNTRRLGMTIAQDEKEDLGTFAVALLLWRAVTQGCDSVIVGGRRKLARAWQEHAERLLRAGPQALRDNFRKDKQGRGLRCTNGAWVLLYDGPFEDDYAKSMETTTEPDIILGDFEYIDRPIYDDAVKRAKQSDDAWIVTLVPCAV